MKQIFLDYSMNSIKAKYPEYSSDKLEEIAYGLEAIYLTLTKTLVIFGIAFILGILKETFILLIFYNILRTTFFGMHAKKSIHCYIISTTLFIGGGLICKYVDINIYIKLLLSIFALICVIKYAPADTYKRPLINAKKRKIYKIISIIITISYIVLLIIFNSSIISKYLFLGLLAATLMIHPLTYRMFQLPYNNYKNYEA